MSKRRIVFNLFGILVMAMAIELALFPFLPSAMISQIAGWIFIANLVAVAVWFTWIWADVKVRVLDLDQEERANWLADYWLRGGRIFKGIAAAICCITLLYLFGLRFVPHLIVLANGEKGSQEFTVKRRSYSRYCRRGVVLDGLPMLAKDVCGMSDDLLAKMKPGTKVVITGKRAWAGMIPDSIAMKPPQ